MAERDKTEPFWTRPFGKRRSGVVVAERDASESAPVRQTPPTPPEQPREPSFAVSGAARREEIGALIANLAGPALAPAPPRAPAAGEVLPAPSLGRAPPREPPAPDAHGWVQLSLVDAARHPLFGIHGWLVLIAILVALGLFRALIEIIDFWETTDHGGLAAWIMAVLRSAMALWAALIFGLLMGRSRVFPTNFVAYSMVNVVYLLLFGLAFAHVTHNMVFAGVAVAIPLNLVAIAYVLRSRRVNVTFRHRVRAKKSARRGKDETHPQSAAPSQA